MKKLKRQGKHIAVSMLAVAFVFTGSVTPTVLHASEVSTQSIISEGDGYTFDVTNKKVTITSNEGTSNWRSDTNLDKFGEQINISTVVIKDGVTEIKDGAFSNCTSLTSVTIPSSVETIGERAFYNCRNLTSITIPDSAKIIKSYAFASCSSLRSVTIPDGVETIEERTFDFCTDLTSVMIPDSIIIIGSRAFKDCYKLTNVTIPDSVTTIEEDAFSHCSALTNVTIPDSVTTIEGGAFNGCSALTNVTIPDSVTTIERSTFDLCNALTSVTIPDSVTTIEDYAFSSCTALTNVTMSSRVTSIGERAFSNINNLTLTMTGATPPTLGNSVFVSVTTLTIKVPKGTGDAYKGATGWSTHSGKISETNEIPRYSGIQASTPTVKESTHNQVTLNTITITNETVEYGISSTNDVSGCTWQDSPIFTSLNENTTYYFFARVKANDLHPADTVTTKVKVTTAISNETKLKQAKVIAVQTINDFVVTNDTEISELLVQLHEDMQSVDGVRASWKATPTIVKATETAAGSMQGTIVLTAGDKTVEIEVNKVITKLDHVYTYDIISGKDVSWDKESTKDLVFTIDGDHTKYKGIKIDGKEVLSGNYTITKGSTIVTLKNAYLKTLSIGKHEVTIVFEGKEVKVSFSITGSTDKPTNGGNTGSTTKTPSTNDTTSNHYMILTVLSGTILAVSLYRRKREINN